MSEIDTGGAAFPIWTDDMPVEGGPGLTIRDYFAGQALAGLTSREARNRADVTADAAYSYADAMLKERTE